MYASRGKGMGADAYERARATASHLQPGRLQREQPQVCQKACGHRQRKLVLHRVARFIACGAR